MNDSTPTTALHLFLESLCPRKPRGLAFPHQSYKSLLGVPKGAGARGRSNSFSRRTKKRRPCQPTSNGSFGLILAPEVHRPSEGAQQGPEG